jgi:hypothetical protein
MCSRLNVREVWEWAMRSHFSDSNKWEREVRSVSFGPIIWGRLPRSHCLERKQSEREERAVKFDS